jgi:tRNA A37 threonylcarbamoyladenosine synthetase subunit TsaC/SUA5/YrdC
MKPFASRFPSSPGCLLLVSFGSLLVALGRVRTSRPTHSSREKTRDDLLERIDMLVDEEVPYSSRSGVVAMLLTLGLQEGDRRQEKPPANRILAQG